MTLADRWLRPRTPRTAFPPYELGDPTIVGLAEARTNTIARIYHKGQEQAWDGRAVLDELVAKHGADRVPRGQARGVRRDRVGAAVGRARRVVDQRGPRAQARGHAREDGRVDRRSSTRRATSTCCASTCGAPVFRSPSSVAGAGACSSSCSRPRTSSTRSSACSCSSSRRRSSSSDGRRREARARAHRSALLLRARRSAPRRPRRARAARRARRPDEREALALWWFQTKMQLEMIDGWHHAAPRVGHASASIRREMNSPAFAITTRSCAA